MHSVFLPWLAYTAWDFGWRSDQIVSYRMCSRSGPCWGIPIADHGLIGLMVDGGLALFLAVNVAICLWRIVTRAPQAVAMQDRLWLHPSYGRQLIPFNNIAYVRIERSAGLVVLVVDLIYPSRRNWIGRLLFWKIMTYRLPFSSGVIRGGVPATEAFYRELATRVKADPEYQAGTV